MLYAAQKNNPVAMLSMVHAGGTPERQGSNWVEILMAAVSASTQEMAMVVYSMMSNTSLLPVSQHGPIIT